MKYAAGVTGVHVDTIAWVSIVERGDGRADEGDVLRVSSVD